MPATRRRRSGRRNGAIRRRRSMVRRRRTRKMRRYVQPVPLRFYTKLKYAFTGQQLALTAGTINRQTWAANGLFDPDISGTGHQPYYYDQLSTMYGSYRVYGVKIQIWAQATTSASQRPIYLTLWAQPSGDAIVVNPDQMVELFGSKTTMLSGNEQGKFIKRYYRCNRIFNVNRNQYNTSFDYQGKTGDSGTGTNPLNLGLIQCQAYSLDSAATVNMTTKLTYYCCFFGRKNNVIS